MNVYDSARMTDVLAPIGYEATDNPDGADLVILNTCHIREKAAEKVYSELGRIRPLKEKKYDDGGRMLVAVAGCVAQAEGAEIMRRAPVVDMVFGPQTYHRLPELVAKAVREGGGVLDTDFPVEDKFDHLPAPKAQQGVTAFLTIQEGCDKFCSFCVVPYTRGAEFSRDVVSIEQEARAFVDAGVREITLLGQNVNAFNGTGPDGDRWSLAKLLVRLSEIDGLDRLRYTTSHPRDMSDDLIAVHRDLPQLMPYLHLPVQAGSDRILQAMNRGHTADDYRRLIDKIRDARPDIAMSSDFIVGFPGESDRDFEATMALIRDVTYSQAFSFKYSARPGTPGASLPQQIDETVKSERLTELQKLLTEQQAAFNAACVGSRLPVLFEGKGRQPGQALGRSPYLQPIHVSADADLVGQIHDTKVLTALPNSLSGELCDVPAAMEVLS